MECCILFVILGGLMVAMCVGEYIFECALRYRRRKVVSRRKTATRTRRDALVN